MSDSPPLLFRRHGDHLLPVDDLAREAMANVRDGDICRVELKQPRNLDRLRKYWALLHLVAANQTRYPNADALHQAVKIALGQYDAVQLLNGSRVIAVPKSIAFGAMPEHEFSAYLNSVIRLVVEHILPGVEEGELRRQLEDLVGGERRSWAA